MFHFGHFAGHGAGVIGIVVLVLVLCLLIGGRGNSV